MKKILLILLGLGWIEMAWGQYAILGKVVDQNSRQAMDFVNVSVSPIANAGGNEAGSKGNGAASGITGGITDENGEFAIVGLSNGTYQVSITFMGYEAVNKTATINGKNADLGKIYLREDSRRLEEVQVVGQGTTMRFELDRKIFSVDQNLAAAGGSVTDALENIPSVDVDQEGNISLRNSENVEIWINGKPAGLSAENRAQILQQMPAESIQEIEVITNPSAKYSPEGTSGVINLVMKKNRKAGYYGSLTAGLEYGLSAPWKVPPGANIGLSMNMNKGIVDAYFNVGYRYHSSNGSNLSERYRLAGEGWKNFDPKKDSYESRMLTKNENNRNGGGIFARAGINIRVADHSTLGFSGFGMISEKTALRNNSNGMTTYTITDAAGELIREYNRENNGSGWHPGGNAVVDYTFKMGQHKLDVNASYNNWQWNQDNTYTSYSGLKGHEGTTIQSAQRQATYNTDQSVETKADYEWKPTKQSRLEAGYQMKMSWRNTLAEAWDDPEMTKEIFGYYSDFASREQNHAIYVTYGNKFWGRLSIQVGLRGELYNRHLESRYKDGSGTIKDAYAGKEGKQDTTYFQVYPSAYISYDFGHGHELQVNYTRRIERPWGHTLNPRQDFSDSTNISCGNPSLLPSYSNNLELNYLKTWERHTLSGGLFWRYKEGIVQNTTYMDGNVMRNTYINAANQHELGVEVSAKNRLFGEIMQLNTSIQCYYNQIGRSEYENFINGSWVAISLPSQSAVTWGARIQANFLFTKTFTGQISARYRSPRTLAQGMTSHSYNIDLGLRKTFLQKTLALSLNVRDLLDSRGRKSYTWGKGFYQYAERRWHSRTISLTLTYNFGNTKKKNEEYRSRGDGASGIDDDDSAGAAGWSE